MGFWDTVGKVAKGTINAIEEQSNRIKEYKEEMEKLSNAELKEKYKSAGGWRKNVVISVIKERRGY